MIRCMSASRRLLACFAVALAGCAQAQMASNVGGDGVDRASVSEALGSIERSACSETSELRGPILMTVVFATDGTVTDAKLTRADGDTSAPLPRSPRADCLVERLRDLHVPPFKGAPTKAARKLTLD